MFGVKLKGKEVLTKEEIDFLDKFLPKEVEKIQRNVKEDFLLILKFGVHRGKVGKIGGNKKYGVQARVRAGRSFDAGSSEWDFKKAVHSVLKKVENEISSRVR